MPTEPRESKFEINGLDSTVWEWPGDGVPILFCHATGFHSRCWDQIIRRLPGRRCYALDFRGHGRSAKPDPPFRWRSFGEDLAELARQLGLERAIGVGHSMGGHALTLAAALVPAAFSRLLLLDPVIRPQEGYRGEWKESHFAARRRNQWASADEMFQRFENRPPFASWDRTVLRDYCDYGLLPAPDGNGFVLACPPATEASIYANSSRPESNIYDEIARVTAQVQVVRSARQFQEGTPDMNVSPTAPDLASYFQKGADVHLPDRSHFIPMEAPAWVAHALACDVAVPTSPTARSTDR
jgi:lipase